MRAAAPLVEVARSQPSSVVTKRDIDTLPVLERNFLVLAQLLPGSGPINSTVNRFATTKFGGVADQRAGYTTLIDGGDIDDTVWGSPTINVGEDAIQEFKVFRHQFDAQYGHALNAVVTVATRAGTNRFSGTGFYFGRDDALNARYPLCGRESAVRRAAGRRIGRRSAGARPQSLLRLVRARQRRHRPRHRAACRAIRLPARENGVFPAETDNQMASARLDHRFGGTHLLSARYALDRQQSLRASRRRSSPIRARWTSSTDRTAWWSKRPGARSRTWRTPSACTC